MKKWLVAMVLAFPFAARAGVPQELAVVAEVCAQACQAECSSECSVDITTREILVLAHRSAQEGIEQAAIWLRDFCPEADVNVFLEQVNVALAGLEFPTYQTCKETKKGLRCKSKRRFRPVNAQP